ncbi:MerR family transcriptional regulator [Neoasaia chiangmaiensis NBRC 101099]|uniref:MerR family transcriptional regulator n=1 Tax=Neoasaia chiangmaiensis TaxID=320497 RepID=UPI00098A606D|nr:MerR family transcriptional regulator [Neoasaia chiangmaiensis]GBR38552.1 MerR family transcriptional regulator [Neoasaia chiangmaiensis NBRC 101099]GEN15846.1 MerR family transcriptional regulator [Neoasaia chiangmaiensis]
MTSQTDAASDEPAGGERLKKAPHAYRTISEVADELHVPQHVLRFWETRFPEVKPLKRGGGRRYYRPEDILILRRISELLYVQGYTIKGVQRVLREGGESASPTGVPEVPETAENLVDVEDPLEIPPIPEPAVEDIEPEPTAEAPSGDVTMEEVVIIETVSADESPGMDPAIPEAAPVMPASTLSEEQWQARLNAVRAQRNHLRGTLQAVLEELDEIRQLLPH